MAKGDHRRRALGDHMLAPETQMMGYGYDPSLSEGALKPPIFMTSTFAFSSAEAGKSFFELAYNKREAGEDEVPGLIYSRINNPNLEIVEERLTLWDDSELALVFSSGMAAITTALMTYLRPGDVLVHSAPIYGGTEYLIRHILPEYGIQAEEYLAGTEGDTLSPALERAREKGRIAVIYGETPANPTNQLVNLDNMAHCAARIAEETGHKPVTMVDNTFLGPLWQQPAKHGIDITLYSLTKYVGGHSDLVAGGATGSADIMKPVRGFRTIFGTQCDANTAWLLMRSLETLSVRMEKAADNAASVARFLRDHPRVERVHYLGFLEPGDARRVVFDKQCKSAGSTFSFDVTGGEEGAFSVLNRLRVIKLAVSLGGTESLMEAPYAMTHSDVPDDVKDRLGITPATLRISVGIENPDDLIADLRQALED